MTGSEDTSADQDGTLVAQGTAWAADLSKLSSQAAAARKKNKATLKRVKKMKDLDARFHALHHEAFEHIDCLTCANCCKTTSPRVLDRDTERLARYLKMRPAQFVDAYLHIDEDGDFVLNDTPCPFLGSDNYCSVYDARPAACREYPHTDARKMSTHVGITLENTAVCPAVAGIVDRLGRH
ncbi:hypothetical protein CYMTET_29718 [Cymbomonas tetramitiformis]|uniref:Zinc/iron-chelating domain-containing protein n=1 Tax=Cymbomonas tetramitiformis TaxID=36881 RepID=A0AAE0FKG9_9CHLO|nr:hypothetical protein CYMTET_29718 [Cymbomonas tetramitiformis]